MPRKPDCDPEYVGFCNLKGDPKKLHVGATYSTREERFANHRSGLKSASTVNGNRFRRFPLR